ncbi:uncharacterized protein EI97DRAFT_432905 [Westerdykella ornata]|uniref:Uncharacterized protein n=1 Tax=Westerdykella ornata TaxID=318751 RepID=A0A6A6JJ92_WESOR|nr:uncharacterized protein EI97DRAFT_432905 [Westerdykella ornata]KAF2276661.1 hypothetical protein EI97DRAFT_432905 [Westerdykella ornata]
MKLLDLLFVASTLGGVSSALPAPEAKGLEPITGTIIATGVTEKGEPYTITSDIIPHVEGGNFPVNPGNATSALVKRIDFGTCDAWHDNKYCYCLGAVSSRGDSYWGSQDFCNANKFKNFRGDLYSVKWLPTVKIEYWVTNRCDHDRYVGDNCGEIFLNLIDWCEWPFQTAKGGHQQFDDCLTFRFDVTGR